MNINSCWGFHNWVKWKTVNKGDLVRPGYKHPTGRYEEQRRECAECGKAQLRKIRT